MQLTETQEQMLREVLDQLMTSYKASVEELSATYAYLFGEHSISPFFTDKELFETILYLRETVVTHALTDLESMLNYYEERKKQMHDYLTEIASMDGDAMQSGHTSDADMYQLRIAETIVIRPAELVQLTRQISTEAGRLFEQLYSRIIQLFESAPFPAAGEKDIHLVVKKHVRELVMTDKPVSMQWESVHMGLPFGIKYYVEQFASHFNGEQIVIMHFGSHLSESLQKLSWENTKWMDHECNSATWRYFYGGHYPDYAAIMNVLKREEPILDCHFKIQLTEWLVYSKLVVSDCQEGKTLPVSSIRPDLSFRPLFQQGAVRVYGGSNLHWWIEDLFKAKLSVKKWVILKRRPGHFWLTSDNPGFLININDLQEGFSEVVPRHSLLDIRPDSVLYYPLSKEYCLKLEPNVDSRDESRENMAINYVMPADDEQEFVNGVTVSTYKKVVITNQRTTFQQIQSNHMAKNGKVGDGHRDGQVTDRSQTHNPQNDKWVKRDTETGRFIDQKADDKPFKGVRKEK
jgi:hypothetical protein